MQIFKQEKLFCSKPVVYPDENFCIQINKPGLFCKPGNYYINLYYLCGNAYHIFINWGLGIGDWVSDIGHWALGIGHWALALAQAQKHSVMRQHRMGIDTLLWVNPGF